ncbi:hypothetical protein Vretifemale_6066, partial [Volvox reticuliferus]
QDAKLRAEQSSARRVAEVSELRSALEQQVGVARQEALDARTQLATVKEQLDGVLSEEFLQLLEEELRISVIQGHKSDSAAAAAAGSASSSRRTAQQSQQQQQFEQELRGLESREAALRRQSESLSAELTELQSAAVSRLGPALVARAQELEGTAGRYRQVLRDRQAMKDEQGAARASQQLEAVNSELGSLYRLVMSAEARDRERAARAELQGRELELRTLMEKRAQLLEQQLLQQQQQPPQQKGASVASPASSGQAKRLRQAVNARVRVLVWEREQQLMQQAATREQQLQAQLQARLAESRDAQQRELKAVQETVAQQMRLMESSWKGQLDAFTRSLQEAATEKERLAVQAVAATGQVRQQLTELETLRRELAGAQAAVVALRRAAEDSHVTAAQQSAAAAKEVQKLRAQVQQLQITIDERERQYAASAAAAAATAAAAAAAATNGQFASSSPWLVTQPPASPLQPTSLPTQAASGPTAPANPHSLKSKPSSAALEPIVKGQQREHQPLQQRRQPGQQLQPQHQQSDKQRPQPRGSSKTSVTITATTASISDSSIPNPDSPLLPPQHKPNTDTDLPSADAAAAATLPAPLTPIRPDWPPQFGGVVPMVSTPRPADGATATAAAAAAAADGSGNSAAAGSGAVATASAPSSQGHVTGKLQSKPSVAEAVSSEASEPSASLAVGSWSGSGSERDSGAHEHNRNVSPGGITSGSNSSDGGFSAYVGEDAVLSVWSRILASSTQMDADAPAIPPPPAPVPEAAAVVEPAAVAMSRAADSAAKAEAPQGGGIDPASTDAGAKVQVSDTAAIGSTAAANGIALEGSSPPDIAAALSSSRVSEATVDATVVAAVMVDAEPQDVRRVREREQHLPEHERSISEATATAVAAAEASTVSPSSPSSSASVTEPSVAAATPAPHSLNTSPADAQPREQPLLQPQAESLVALREQVKGSPDVAAVQLMQPQSAPAFVTPPAVQWQQQSPLTPQPPKQQRQPKAVANASRNSPNPSGTSPPSPPPIVPPPSRQSQQPSSAASTTSTTTSRTSSPAAAAMAAAAGAAAAAKRAAALEASSTKGAAPRVDAPPISEWGRPKPPSDDGLSRSGPAASGATGRSPGDRSLTGAATATTPFFSEAELGAEIAAIAQSLVQRTIGGSGSSVAGATAARPGGPESAPSPRGTSDNPAPPAVDDAAAPAPDASTPNPSGPRKLSLVMAAHSMSAMGKGEQGSEDA